MLPTEFKFRIDHPENPNAIIGVSTPDGSLEDIVEALHYISSLDGTDRQVDIINMSFGNECTIPSLNEKLCELARNKVLIASAGIILVSY